MDAFYEQVDTHRYLGTPATAGPWDPAAQHGGPPSALLAHVLERDTPPRPDLRLTRMTVELLRPVPVGELDTTTRVLRSGRRTELLEAELSAGGVTVLRMTASRVAAADGAAPAVPEGVPAPPMPESGEPAFWSGAHLDGYMSSVEWRYAAGSVATPGPAAVWARPRLDLVAGRALAPVERALLLADSGSGVGAALDIREWTFVNSDLTVLLHRHPAGEWVCLESATAIDSGGIGCAHTRLSDSGGSLGYGLQTLVVGGRGLPGR
ncbi:MAG TPA: thioesterase family protein [Mycobacteriales bacterium]